MMTEQEIAYLRSLPECVEVEFPAGSGTVRPWLLCDLAFERAEKAGVTMEEIMGARLIEAQSKLQAIQRRVDAAETDAEAVQAAAELPVHLLTRFAALRLWAGFNTFATDAEPSPSLDFCMAAVNGRNYAGYLRAMNAPFTAEAEAEGKAEAPAEAPGAGATVTPTS